MSDATKPTASTIIYTLTDEAPALATRSLLPVIAAFAGASGVNVETRDISLAGRILAAFSDRLPAEQRRDDHLAELGELVTMPEANIIKLPNISASLPQLKEAVAELQADGYDLPDYPDEPATDAEVEVLARYASVMGSAVNPVLREGNSDRRAPAAVKAYARNHPHSMGAWSPDSKTRVATMTDGDFRSTERSVTVADDDSLSIRFTPTDGEARELRAPVSVSAGTIVDGSLMSAAALDEFLTAAIARAKAEGVLWSIHLKATMMKVSDPIMFGHAVRAFFPGLFAEYGDVLAEAGFNPNNGLASLDAAINNLPVDARTSVESALAAGYAAGPELAMVNSDKGITNLHVPSDVIIDASMPAMIRTSGQMWGPDGESADDAGRDPRPQLRRGVRRGDRLLSCERGARSDARWAAVPNVGSDGAEGRGVRLARQDVRDRFERRGPRGGRGRQGADLARGRSGRHLARMPGEGRARARLGEARGGPRARHRGAGRVLAGRNRAHDAELIKKVELYLRDHDTKGLDLRILDPKAACKLSLERMKAGQDTISVTGNVLRDYNTDLFPILELGTSAKMLSIVPLMNGGGLFETGAGGSAPKHVQQFQAEGHLRWDSLGEFLAIAVSFEHLADTTGNAAAKVLAVTLDQATAAYLTADNSPGRKAGQLDNKGSHFYLALYWAEALAAQTTDAALAARFAPVAAKMRANEAKIVAELAGTGKPVDLGGYYHPDPELASKAMRPSATLNAIIDGFS
jgi:isocitrate dehydrogenase